VINEYFVEPSLIYKWASDPKDTALFLDKFGLGHPRLISSFPKAKGSKLRQLIIQQMPGNLSHNAEKRVEEFAASLSNEALPRSVPKELGGEWTTSVKAVCKIRPPDVVISSEPYEELDYWITEDAAIPTGSKFYHRTQATPPRTAAEFTEVIRNFLRYSRRIVLVDPWVYTKKGIQTITSFIECTQDRRIIGGPLHFQIIYNAKTGPSKHHMRDNLSHVTAGKEVVLEIIPVSEKATGEKLHNRYVLTEFGGVSFGVGTDSGDKYHTDDLFLLDRDTYLHRWNQYWNAEAFDRA